MAKITISAHEHRGNWASAPASARAFADRPFVNGDNQSVAAGDVNSENYVAEVAVTYADGVAQIASFATTDRLDSTILPGSGLVKSTYTLALYDANGQYLDTVFSNIKIPETPTTTSWSELARVASARSLPYKSEYFNREEITELLDDLSVAPLADGVQYGKVRLDEEADSLSDPVAVGANSTKALDNLSNYNNSLAEAVSVIGADERLLTINNTVAMSADIDVPINITLDFGNNGFLSVTDGAQVTIRSMRDPGNRQVFDIEDETCLVYLHKNAVPELNLVWWTGNGNYVDITNAIENVVATIGGNGGGAVRMPLTWEADGNISLPSGSIWRGMCNSPSTGIAGSIGRLKSSSTADCLFRIGGNKYSIQLENMILSGNGTADGILAEGTGGDTSADIRLKGVTIEGWNVGFNHNSLGDSWQLAQVGMSDCILRNNATQIRYSSVNAQLTTVNTNIEVPPDGVGLLFDQTGATKIIGMEMAGGFQRETIVSVDTTANSVNIPDHGFNDEEEIVVLAPGGTIPGGLTAHMFVKYLDDDNIQFSATAGGAVVDISSAGTGARYVYRFSSKAIVINGSHGVINIDGYQDEGFLTSIENNASDTSGIIHITGSNIQGKAQMNASCFLIVEADIVPSYFLQGAASGGYAYIRAHIRNETANLDNTAVTPPVLSSMTGGMTVVSEDLPNLGYTVRRYPRRFISPLAFLGDPSTPVVSIGHITNGTNEDKPLLRLGRQDTDEEFDFYYDFFRKHSTGWLHLTGNQSGFRGLNLENLPLKVGDGTAINKELGASASLNFGSIAAGATAELTITVTGATTGSVAWASPDTTLESGLMWSAYVSASNQVTVRVLNTTGSPVDPAERTWIVWCRS